jgi:hypothetical protein
MKRAVFTLCGGVALMLLGIFFLFLVSLFSSASDCISKSDFYSMGLPQVSILISFVVILAGVLTELLGRYKLAKALNNMQIFYNRLNLYAIITLFIVGSIKFLMAANASFFLIEICVSQANHSNNLDFLGYAAIPFLSILGIYFLLKDCAYLAIIFKTILPIVTFGVYIFCLFIFFSNVILFYISNEFLASLIGIQVFIPYLVMSAITYAGILRYEVRDKAKKFSFYDFTIDKKIILLILSVALCIAVAVSLTSNSLRLANILLYTAFIVLLFLPMLLFCKVLFLKKFRILPILIAISAIIGVFSLDAYLRLILATIEFILILSYIFIIPISLAICIVLKLQQRNFMKTSIMLIIASCVLFGYLVFPY